MEYYGQSEALNESLSDVFGSLIASSHAGPDRRRGRLEADRRGPARPARHGVALRSMKARARRTTTTSSARTRPATMEDYVRTGRDNGGVHINSGIPNHAFYLAATALGGYAWEKPGRLWYDAAAHRRRAEGGRPVRRLRHADGEGDPGAVRRRGRTAGRAEAWEQVGVRTL
ncbi:M4 family metallopeptidase [Streptomyces tricolor]|nr:M4 family metallopeptidase [Streptomyces tricolor]